MFRRFKRIINKFLATPPIGTWEKWLAHNGVEVRGNVKVFGKPCIIRWGRPTIVIENGVILDSDPIHNDAGIIHPCTLSVTGNGKLTIGENSGFSGVQICCVDSIKIGSNVLVGANVTIYDTDFHPINPYQRFFASEDSEIGCKEVVIEDYVWVGANAIILKGVHIGKGAVIGAGSVVTCDVPELTVYAGNPAKFVKKIEMSPSQYQTVFGE